MKTLKERIAEKTAVLSDGCWKWTGAKNGNGYGQIWFRGRLWLTHRLVLQEKLGRDLLSDECALHRCDNPSCVNPAHIWIGTKGDNSKDMAAKGRSPAQVHPERRARGEVHGKSKLTVEKVREIRRLCSEGWTQGHIAELFGVTRQTISYIARGATWKEI